MNAIQKMIKEQKEHPIKTWFLNIYYSIRRFFINYDIWHKYLYWFLQRVFRGYDDRVYWDLGYSIIDYALPKLKHFRKMKRNGYPMGLSNKEWNKILDKMIWSFERISKDDIDFFPSGRIRPRKQCDKMYKRQDEGLELFGKYLLSMWD